MKANPSAPEGLALQGASAALHGLPVESTTGGAARLASAPLQSQRGSRGILRQAPDRGLKTQADQGFESLGRPFLPLRERARDRIRAGAAPREWSCAPNAHPTTCLEHGLRRRRRARKSPVRPGNIDRREHCPRPQTTTHWWACPYADNARSNCGCAPCRRCAPTAPWASSTAPALRRPTWPTDASSEPTACVTRNSHRVRVAAPI